jgi:uncharacterized protein
MAATPALADHLIAAASVAASVVHWRWAYPRAAREIGAGVTGARLRLYRYIVVVTWLGAACVAAVWLAYARPWALLGLGLGEPVRLGAGLGLAALYVALAVAQRRAVLAHPDVLGRLARSFRHVEPLIPRTPAERNGFRAVAATAGICEELFYRGYLMWYVGALAGLSAAVVVSSAAFGFDHMYLGRRYALRTAIGGLAFAAVVVVSGSLWPAIVIHAAADLVSGDLGERVFAGAGLPAGSGAPAAD